MITNPHTPYLEIANSLNIHEGETILLSSDIFKLFAIEYLSTKKKPDINLFIDSFINKIGPTGTLLIPTFNWDFCKGTPFVFSQTKGRTGSIGNVCLERPDFKRTPHAIYSFAVYGKDQMLLCENDYKDSFGPSSIFAYLDSKHAKNIVIGVNLTHCFTFVHYVEELSNVVKYRYIKDFTGSYIDAQNTRMTKTYSMYVRDLSLNVITNIDPMEDELCQKGLAHRKTINTIPFIIIPDLHATVEPILYDIIYNNSRKICQYTGQ